MRDEIAIGLELLAAFKTGVHPKAMSASQMLHHLFDGQFVNVAKIARIRFVKRLDAEFV